MALEEHLEELREKDAEDEATRVLSEGTARRKVMTDASARALADTPMLTGDPKWDALELAETDPSRPLLNIDEEELRDARRTPYNNS